MRLERKLCELLDSVDPAWPLVQEWLAAARNPVEVLPPDRENGEEALYRLAADWPPVGAARLLHVHERGHRGVIGGAI